MQNHRKAIAQLVITSVLAAASSKAEIEYEISTGYTSEYIFRGLNLGQDLIETGVEASTEFNGFGLSAGVWHASFETAGLNDDELNLYAEVSKEFGFATAAIGYIWYYFPQAGGSVAETYFSLSRELAGVDFSLAYFWDVSGDNDGYTELSASKGFKLNDCLALQTSGAVGYLFEEGDLSHLTLKVALDYSLTETATLSPFIAHSWSLDDASTDKNQLFGGAALTVSF